ncbi:winged helix-turn-helix domain-containing protein [Tamlana fucoidanivorans]|uniref:Winged helix-turn-helix domain-containing protein n=1 Tax=Allotamlana fucoidanivorans TaxID=2583814 RepID=A0A5C4SID1_9FLAO|nr:helix-turn-helix domain-containing protein [Tamlana fucoidanivorans]TNJ43082.1 winged helix-turn-helix domain-containing protein [Tamlana fucoidanivorans]
MIQKEDKIEVLNRLLTSNAFSKTTTSNVLLKYLIESSINNKNLNATDISLEIFGSQYEPEKSEATIRVNIYHLRNKLKKYFDNEGVNDDIFIEIKRGQYGVSFYRKSKPTPKYTSKQKLLILGVLLSAIVGIIFSIIKLNQKDPIWEPFFANKKENTLYLFDIFGFVGPNIFGSSGFHRDYNINSVDEFYKEIKKHPEQMKDYSPGRNVYVNFLSAYSVKDLSKHFYRNHSEFKIHKLKNLTTQQLKEQNSIYLGPLKYDNSFVDFFNLKSKRIQITKNNEAYNDGHITYKDLKKNIDTIIKLNSNGHSHEHVLIAKLNGDNDTSNLMFFSNHGFGATAAVDYFTNKDSIIKFNDNYLKNSAEFIALFEVTGKERASIKVKQIVFDNNN